MQDTVEMGMHKRLTELLNNAERVLQRQALLWAALYPFLQGSPCHVLTDEIGLARFFTDIVEGHDVGMIAQAGERLGFALDAVLPIAIEPLRLEQRQRDGPV